MLVNHAHFKGWRQRAKGFTFRKQEFQVNKLFFIFRGHLSSHHCHGKGNVKPVKRNLRIAKARKMVFRDLWVRGLRITKTRCRLYIRQMVIGLARAHKKTRLLDPMPSACACMKDGHCLCPSTPRARVGKKSWPAMLLARIDEGWATTVLIKTSCQIQTVIHLITQSMWKVPLSLWLSQWVRAYLTSPTDAQSLSYSRQYVKVSIKSHISLPPAIAP